MPVDIFEAEQGNAGSAPVDIFAAEGAKPRQLGTGEVASRAGSSFVHAANAYAAAPAVGIARLVDIANGLLGMRTGQPSYTDILGERFVEPSLRQVERAALKPNEQAGPVGNVALSAAPELGKFVPDIVEGMGLAKAAPQQVVRAGAPVIDQVIANLRGGATAGVPAGFRRAEERQVELQDAGVDPLMAAPQAAASGAMTVGQFALPASAGSAADSIAARIASRAGQGAALNVASGASTRAVENAMLPDQAAELRQPLVSPESAAIDAITGAIFGQMGGRNPRPHPSRADLGYRDLELAPVEPPQPRPAPTPEYDPAAAAKAVTEALFRTPEGAPTAPAMQLIPKGHEAPAGVPPAPDVSEVPIRVPPEMALEGGGVTGADRQALLEERAARQQARTVEQPPVVAVNSRGEAIPADENLHPTDMGTVAGKMQNELARQASEQAAARRTFDIAERQRERKQAAQDVGGRDLREARAGGSTSAEGTAATTPESFQFLDVKRTAGKVTSTGPEVKILGETTIKEGDKVVPAYDVEYTGAHGEPVREVVAQTRVSALERPKGPRFAQDIAASSYAPPRGVGTGEQQPKPREAAQRITTEPAPEGIPGERAAQRGEATRADVTEGIHAGGEHAGDVRGDQGQDVVQRQAEGGGAARGGRDLQQPPPGGQHADGTELRPAGEHRGEDARTSREPVSERDSLDAFDQERDKAFKQGVADDMRALAKTAGWYERGGRLVRHKHSEVQGDETISRTKWVGQEWFVAMRSALGRKGLSDRGPIMLSVEKWLEGEQLTPNERRTVDHMLKEVMDLRDQAEFAGIKVVDAQAADTGLTVEGVERTPQNLYDVDYLSRVDPDVLERLAMQHGDDTSAFMRAVAKEVNGEHEGGTTTQGEPARADTSGGGGAQSEARAAGADTGAGGRAAPEGEPRQQHGGAEHQGGQGSESRPGLALESPTEQQLRTRDAEQRRVAEEKARKEAAPPPEEFKLSGSDRPADEAAARGQQGLFEQGTLSANPFANPKIIAEAVKWAFGDAKAWSDSLAELKNAIGDLKKKTKSTVAENPVTSFVRAVFDTAAGDMRAVADKVGSKTMGEVLDHFQGRAGEGRATKEAFHSAVRSYVNQRLVEVHKLLGDMVNDRDKMKQIAALVRNPSGIKPGTPIHDAAAGIRKMLDSALKYMKDAGVDVGEVKGGYYPREFDIDAVLRSSKAFMDAAALEYRSMGMAPDVALKAAKELHDGLVFGETSTLFRTERGATAAPFLKGRVFGKGVDSETHPLNRFLVSDPALALSRYFERAAKRAEIARRFGDNFANWQDIAGKIVNEGGGAAMQKMTDYVAMAAGIKKPGVSDGALRASSVARTWGALMFLEKATLSSLSEFVVPALRSGNVLDAGRSLKNTMAELFTKTKGAEERRAFAEDLGLISGHISSSLASARFAGGEPMGRVESQILDRFFKRTGLNQWTDATRIAAADLGRVFIRRLAKDMEGNGNLTKRYLAELGVPTEQAKDFSKYVLARRDGMPVQGDLDGSLGDLYRVAVRKFVAGGIMDPHAALRPKWMNHPLGAVVGQLQAFNYAFYENVLKRTAKLTKDALTEADYTMGERAQMVMPMLMLPMVTAVAFAVGEARDAVFGDPEKRAKETGTEKAIKAVSRGTPIAPIDPFINYLTAARYGRSFTEAMSGPVFSTGGRVLDSIRDAFLKNSEHTNTQERRAWKSVWDIFIEPTVNAMLFASPVSMASAAITQAAGSSAVREKLLVAPAAGEPKKEAGRSASRSSTRSASR